MSVCGGPFKVTSLWQACSDYARCNNDAIQDSLTGKTWHLAIAEDAAVG
jgi:hypothetical protein